MSSGVSVIFTPLTWDKKNRELFSQSHQMHCFKMKVLYRGFKRKKSYGQQGFQKGWERWGYGIIYMVLGPGILSISVIIYKCARTIQTYI